MSLRLFVPEHKQPGQGMYSDKDFADDAVTVQTGSKLEAFFATMRSFVFFAKNPSCTAFGGA